MFVILRGVVPIDDANFYPYNLRWHYQLNTLSNLLNYTEIPFLRLIEKDA